MPSRVMRGGVAGALVLVLIGSGCGSGGSGAGSSATKTASNAAPADSGAVSPSTPAPADAGVPAEAPKGDAVAAAPGPAAGSSTPAPSGAPAAPGKVAAEAAPAKPGAPSKSAAAAAPAAGSGSNPAPGQAASPAPAGSGGGAGSQAGGLPDAGPRDTSPITIGSVGTLSGPAGSTIRQTSEGVKVWAAWVNAHGGAAGHQVKLIIADDGGDPARHKAEVQRLVEGENVVALVANPDALTGASGVDYVTSKGVPYIGGDGGGDWFYSSPMFFPQGTVGKTLSEAEVFDAGDYARLKGKKKFGIVTCTEADFCRVSDKIWAEKAKAAGLDLVYQARTSLVQPDFTAECLAAQRAGAELLELAIDASSIRRFSQSCARQNYHPFLGWPAGIAQDDQKDEPALEGARFTLFTFSWIDRSNPAALEFAEAMSRFGKDLKPFTAGHSGGWTAGKLFEKALSAVPGKVTRESVLAGLWSLKGETLGGLTAPLTFTRGQNAPRTQCWTTVAITNGKFTPLRDGKFTCR